MPRKQKISIRIALFGGKWYAMPLNNNRATRFALVPAIDYCKRLNQEQKR